MALGEKAFRAEQLSRHYFAGHLPEQMTDLAAPVRAALTAGLLPPLLDVVREISCDDDATVKTLWRGHDGTLIESVLMRYPDRTTVCVSSQAGCGMACPFCATGQAGLTRNLSTGEIVEQVVAAQRTESVRGGRVSNVVFMGMGVTQWPVATTRARPGLTCGFTASGSCEVSSEGVLDSAVRRLRAVGPSVRADALVGVSRCRRRRGRRGASMTLPACR